jgi:sugar phosphate isomerase/epimerase
VPLPPDIGLAAATWFDQPLAVALARIAPVAGLAEVYSDYNHSLTEAHNRQAATQSGLQLTVHGPWEDADVGHPHETARKAALAVHRRHLEAAAQVGAAIYVLHPDYSLAPIVRSDGVRAALQRSIVELAKMQDAFGVPVALENMPGSDHTHFALPGDLNLGELGLALDTGHAASCGALAGFLREPRARLRHVHLHDNAGPVAGEAGDDAHLALGLGVVDADAVLAAARAAGARIIIEVLTPEGVAASLAFLECEGLVPAV